MIIGSSAALLFSYFKQLHQNKCSPDREEGYRLAFPCWNILLLSEWYKEEGVVDCNLPINYKWDCSNSGGARVNFFNLMPQTHIGCELC